MEIHLETLNVLLKKNEELLGNWTQIIFSTNWHPDPKKGFMKVWIDGKLKVDFKGKSNHPTQGIDQSLRYGLYNSSMSRYKNIFETNKMPQRIIFFDGVRSDWKRNVKNYLINLNVKNSSHKMLKHIKFIHTEKRIKNLSLVV